MKLSATVKIFILIIILTGAAAVFLFSPYFFIESVEVKGLETISQDEILTRAGFSEKTNLFFFNEREARKNILENLYIEDVAIKKLYPNKVLIELSERHLSGCVGYLKESFLYIDEYGRVIEVNSSPDENLPLVGGLRFNKFKLGEILEVENKSAFKTVVRYAGLLNKYDLTNKIVNIDVSEPGNTRIFLYKIEINVGGERDADEKIRTILSISKNLPNIELIKGFIDMRETGNQYVLKIIV